MTDSDMKSLQKNEEEAPNEFLITRRTTLLGMLGVMLTPVSALLSPAMAKATLAEATKVDDLLANIPDMCRVTTATVEGPYYIDKEIVRSDIRDGQAGVPIEIELRLVNANAQCSPIAGAAVSIWHCNAEGEYSGYLFSDPNEMPNMSTVDELGHVKPRDTERFLRGVQTTDAEGKVKFVTIIPGWYTPRAVHIHVRAYVSERDMITTQIYFPQALINTVQSTQEPYKKRGVTIYTNENDLVRRQSGVSGTEDILQVSTRADGSLFATMTLGAGNA